MAHQHTFLPERTKLEALIGKSDVIPRPAALLKGVWDAAVQAEVIVSRVRCALREDAAVLFSTSDDAVALKLNKSTLGRQLRDSHNQTTLLTAAKVLASDAGISTDGISIHKKHGPLSAIFGPDIYVILPDEDTAQRLIGHVQLPTLDTRVLEVL